MRIINNHVPSSNFNANDHNVVIAAKFLHAVLFSKLPVNESVTSENALRVSHRHKQHSQVVCLRLWGFTFQVICLVELLGSSPQCFSWTQL